MNVPDDLFYSDQHEWVRASGNTESIDVGARCRIGITDYAADSLGDIVFVELPAIGDTIRAGEPCGEVESTKAVSELFSPLTGVVVAVNDAVIADPATVSADPHGAWLFEVELSARPATLLTSAQYRDLIGA